MAALLWPTIAASEIDGESPITEGLMAKFVQAHEALFNQPHMHKFQTIAGNQTTHGIVLPVNIYAPSWVFLAEGDVEFLFQFEALKPPGPNADYGVKIYDGSQGEQGVEQVVTFSGPDSVFVPYEVRFTGSDFEFAIDEPDIFISFRRISGTSCLLRNTLSGSHWEAVA